MHPFPRIPDVNLRAASSTLFPGNRDLSFRYLF
jgi:hypothetical protein